MILLTPEMIEAACIAHYGEEFAGWTEDGKASTRRIVSNMLAAAFALLPGEPVAWAVMSGGKVLGNEISGDKEDLKDWDESVDFPVIPLFASPASQPVAVKALDDLTLPVVATLFVARGCATARAVAGVEDGPDEYTNLVRITDVAKALEPFRSALTIEAETGKEEDLPCPCTTFEQDEDCPVGYPSLLCSACHGIGIATTETVIALAAEMMKIAEQVDELEDPFAAWESIELLKSSASPSPSVSEMEALRRENERLRDVAARRDEFIIARGLWDEFKEAARD
ncbi:hypothetical protein [Rhizobium sp.]|uniref:hypothetical protein n=1 Tax=Rhizobium sp. TaxID=391 RepID=UPI003F7D9702